MRTSHYIPRKDADFNTWTAVFLLELQPHLPDWGFPEEEYEYLTALYDEFAKWHKMAQEPSTRTGPVIVGKDTARGKLEKALQQDVKEFLTYNRKVSDSDREKLGLPVHKSLRTPAPVATNYPGVKVDSSIIRRLMIYFVEGGHRTKARPHGQRGAIMQWIISDTPPANLTDLLHTSFITRPPFTLDFEEYNRGKTFYFSLCWENTRGKKGPFSPIISAIIP